MVTTQLLQTEQIDSLQISPGMVASIFIILGVAYVVAEVTDRILQALADSLAAERFRALMVIPILKVVIYALASYTIIAITISPSTQQLIAFSGLFGAVLGFGFQELVTDVLGGLSILFERPYKMGDKIAIGDHYGEVVDIGLRSTQIFTPNDSLVTIPNHVFFKESIVNATAGNAEMLVTIEFHIDVDADPKTAVRLVEEAIITSRYVYVTEDLPVDVVLEHEPAYYTITGKGYVNDLRNEEAFRTDVTQRTLRVFQEHGIEQPRLRPGLD